MEAEFLASKAAFSSSCLILYCVLHEGYLGSSILSDSSTSLEMGDGLSDEVLAFL